MAGQFPQAIQAAQTGFAAMDAEYALALERQLRVVEVLRATGSSNINHSFALSPSFRLIFVRGHFDGGSGVNPLSLSQVSSVASAHDVTLFTLTQAGVGSDIHFRVTAEEASEPSAWIFMAGDAVKLSWTNPDSGVMTWGLEVGLALAS